MNTRIMAMLAMAIVTTASTTAAAAAKYRQSEIRLSKLGMQELSGRIPDWLLGDVKAECVGYGIRPRTAADEPVDDRTPVAWIHDYNVRHKAFVENMTLIVVGRTIQVRLPSEMGVKGFEPLFITGRTERTITAESSIVKMKVETATGMTQITANDTYWSGRCPVEAISIIEENNK